MVDDWIHTLLYLTNVTSGVTSQYGKLRSSLFGGITERPDLVTRGCPGTRGVGCMSGRTVAIVAVASGEADLGAAEEESGALGTLRTGGD
ncbi:hypothetical protein RRG08_053505 [Elysia crispata]|uniref:Uncharacterized protein n=1 Tax=Elysia crispata TaxID=231223 RepID=A0AAE0Y207_9GAST|nr:hypothetical protein RRG08_053505 [Elysia crispata]